MKRKTWALTLVAVGLVVAATSTAVSLNPSTWFARDSPTAPGLAMPAASTAVPPPVGTASGEVRPSGAGPRGKVVDAEYRENR